MSGSSHNHRAVGSFVPIFPAAGSIAADVSNADFIQSVAFADSRELVTYDIDVSPVDPARTDHHQNRETRPEFVRIVRCPNRVTQTPRIPEPLNVWRDWRMNWEKTSEETTSYEALLKAWKKTNRRMHRV
jgi:hypothetical protein